ncbi:MAG: proteasome protein [Symploca sp. SIO2E9]|nr:proteasome protein [Symploca sp. SIO2E9]
MTTAAKLDELKKYGESILQELDLVPQNPSSQEDWVPAGIDGCIERLRDLAKKTIELASSPVKIGVMGEFSSGKTLLLGSLIGYADALPVSAIPTTGNITAIHLVQQENLTQTKLDKFRVEYLEHQGVKDCLDFMLEEAETRANAAEIPSENLAQLRQLNPQDAQMCQGIIDWCEQTWKQTQNPELRYLLRELVWFVRSYSSLGAALCGQKYEIDATTAREGLELADSVTGLNNLSFDQLPPAPEGLSNPPDNLSADVLRNSFPLIRRVDVEAKVSKEIWDLSSVRGTNEFVLLDFPGLGAADSGVRDRFLSLRELAEVQTIFILLNGQSPGGDRALKIFKMIEQQRPGENLEERILVGVGRFDQLPLENYDLTVLQELVEPVPDHNSLANPNQQNTPSGAELLTEAKVLEKLKVLKTTIDGAQALTKHKDQVVLLSPMLGLAVQSERWSTVPSGSKEFQGNLQNSLAQTKFLRQNWSQISQQLLDSNLRSSLGRQLRDFAENGGIVKLRELLQTHVAEHGLKQLYDDTYRTAKALAREQNNLKKFLEEIQNRGIPTQENPSFIRLRESIENLEKIYTEFKENIGKKLLKSGQSDDVSKLVGDELVHRMWYWNEWKLLFRNTKKNGIISLPQANTKLEGILNKIAKDKNLGELGSNKQSIPTKSDDYYSVFAQTVKDMEEFARQSIRDAVTAWLRELSTEIGEEQNNLAAIKLEEKFQERIDLIEDKYPESAQQFPTLLAFLNLAIEPQPLQEVVLDECKLEEITINSETLFPLARADKNHKMGQISHWGRDNQITQKPANHLFLVLRQRNEMIASARLQLFQFVSEANKLLTKTLEEYLDQILFNLTQLLQNEALLRDVAADELDTEGSTPTWLKVLSKLTSITYQ